MYKCDTLEASSSPFWPKLFRNRKFGLTSTLFGRNKQRSSDVVLQPFPDLFSSMSDLGMRLVIDAASAGLTSAAISPVIFMIDKSIMESASGRADSIMHSIRRTTLSLIRHPITFFSSLPFVLLYSVYFATYMSANTYDTLASKSGNWSNQHNTFGKFLTTTSVNLTSCVYKDFRYAKLFGTGLPRKMPVSSIILFSARDSLTVFASFNVPPLLAPAIGLNVAQLITPCAMQLLSTPMHLLGLDVYNRNKATFKDRLNTVQQGYLRSTAARICRILPAFGFAGIINRTTRQKGMTLIR